MAIYEILFVSMLLMPQISHKDIVRTRWVGPGEPITFKEWQKMHPEVSPFRQGRVYKTDSKDSSKIQILVNAGIYDSIMTMLNQHISDLEAEDYCVLVDTVQNGTPQDIKDLLNSVSDLNGTLFIGDLPVAWFQMIEDWGWGLKYAEFPIDLYYMDLDGEWIDSLERNGNTLIAGSDGIFDTHLGDLGPEIWFGRLTASPLGGEVNLLNNYFEKAHSYRTRSVSLAKRALVYVDDDWVGLVDEWSNAVGLLYPVRTTVSDSETTYAPDYRTRLTADYEWISVFAHSTPKAHYFMCNGGNNYSLFYATEIPIIDPLAFFYNLFACSNCSFVESGYMGGRYIFTDTYGLGAVGSTKTGSMVNFSDFYGPLAQKKTLGEAFKEWFDAQPLDNTLAKWWFYGMTLLGDPTLKPNMESGVAERVQEITGNIYFHVMPNPFTTMTEIKFQVPMSCRATLTIYNITGRAVKTLINEEKEAGNYNVRFDARELATGIYFARFVAGDYKATRKLILMK